ncbi:hypothetical protein [Bradyrhizobium glycinis]|uniref:hypothetical protein n=1 Tax=Bradyrhizobium glycinis TaxID=2751812 RepID=UPI0018D72537|nr:hypothetical protein [Bradyrhizobium glycinis]MBH5372194.1 hypothetical protein [Bradyrhizobium glycinis]
MEVIECAVDPTNCGFAGCVGLGVSRDEPHNHDADRSKLLADEIVRVATRSDRFDEKHGLLLQRHENVLKEATEVIKTILANEVKRVAARSDYYDQQQVLLLQRYENLSKENSEIIKALIQQPEGCCRGCECDCKKPKDPCQKTNGSK